MLLGGSPFYCPQESTWRSTRSLSFLEQPKFSPGIHTGKIKKKCQLKTPQDLKQISQEPLFEFLTDFPTWSVIYSVNVLRQTLCKVVLYMLLLRQILEVTNPCVCLILCSLCAVWYFQENNLKKYTKEHFKLSSQEDPFFKIHRSISPDIEKNSALQRHSLTWNKA